MGQSMGAAGRRRCLFLFLFLFACLLLAGAALAQEAPDEGDTPDPCTTISKLLTRGFLTQAESVLESAEEADLAKCERLDGSFVEAYLAQAEVLLAARDWAGAQELYLWAARLQPENQQALTGLAVARFFIEGAVNHRARRLAEAGLTEEAAEVLREALKTDPLVRLDEASTRVLAGPWPWWLSARFTVLPWLRTVGEFLVVVLLGWLLGRTLVRWLFARKAQLRWFPHRRLVLGDFDASAIDGSEGKDSKFFAQLTSSITELAHPTSGVSIAVAAAPAQGMNLPELVGKTYPQAQILAQALPAFLKALSCQPLRVSGVLENQEPAGPVVTVHLTRGNTVLESAKLEYRKLGGPGKATGSSKGSANQAEDGDPKDEGRATEFEKEAFRSLADSLAVWLLFHVRRWCWTKIAPQEAQSWDAFALRRSGKRRYRLEDSEGAARAFRAALRDHPEFRAAYANLGTINFPSQLDRAQKHLEKAVELGSGELSTPKRGRKLIKILEAAGKILDLPKDGFARSSKPKERLLDPTYYNALYNLSVVHLHRFAEQRKEDGRGDKTHLCLAAASLERLAETIREGWEGMPRTLIKKTPKHPLLERHLRRLTLLAKVLDEGIRAAAGATESCRWGTWKEEAKKSLDALAIYGLACNHSLRSTHRASEFARERDLIKAEELLQRAIQLHPKLKKVREQDPTLGELDQWQEEEQGEKRAASNSVQTHWFPCWVETVLSAIKKSTTTPRG